MEQFQPKKLLVLDSLRDSLNFPYNEIEHKHFVLDQIFNFKIAEYAV